MQKSAPSIGQDPDRGRLRALVLRPDPLPLGRVRRAGAAEAEELPDHRLLPGGGAARRRVRRADRRRLGRQGQVDRPGAAGRAARRPGPDRGRDRDRARVRADLDRRPGDPAPEDAARRDLRRAHLRAPEPDAGGQPRSRSAPPPTTPTPRPRGSRRSPRAARSGVGQTENQVQIDEIFNALDEQTRASFQRWQQNAAVAIQNRGARPQRLARQPRAVPHRRLRRARDPAAAEARSSRAWCATPATVFEALTEHEQALPGRSPTPTTPSTRSPPRTQALRETFQIFPTFERETRATLDRLDAFQENTLPLVEDLQPVASDVSPTLRSVRRLSPNLDSLFVDLDDLVRSRRRACRTLADTSSTALTPVLDSLDPFLANLNPVINWLDYYKTSVTDFLSSPPAALSGHADAADRPAGGAPQPAPARLHHRGVAGVLPEPPADQPRQRLPAALRQDLRRGQGGQVRRLPELRLRQLRRRADRRRRQGAPGRRQLRALLPGQELPRPVRRRPRTAGRRGRQPLSPRPSA